MIPKLPWLGVALLAACFSVAWAQGPAQGPADGPLHTLLIPPEVLLQQREAIGLTDKQVDQIRARVEVVGPKVQEHQARLGAAMGRLAELLSAEKVDEDAALKQLDQVLAIEKDMKQLHLRILIELRNELTAEQRRAAARIAQNPKPAEGLEQRLQAKIARIEKEVQSRAQAGQSPFDVVGLMQKFPELMQNGQVREAEAVLDRAIKMLGLEGAERSPRGEKPAGPPRELAEKIQVIQQRAERMRQNGQDVSEIQKRMSKLGPLVQQGKIDDANKLLKEVLELTDDAAADDAPGDDAADEAPGDGATFDENTRLSPEAVRAEVNALNREDIAWRKIAWKTCLLDGLKASREQKKPIILWVFIDRPIDDERC